MDISWPRLQGKARQIRMVILTKWGHRCAVELRACLICHLNPFGWNKTVILAWIILAAYSELVDTESSIEREKGTGVARLGVLTEFPRPTGPRGIRFSKTHRLRVRSIIQIFVV